MDSLSNESKIIIYQTDEGKMKVNVFFAEENFWMTQKTMAELFDVQKPAISKHLKNIYETGELKKLATVSIMETVQNEGGRDVKRDIEFYNLDAIIAVGYRVNSKKATQFRIWATQSLKEYLIKGFVLNDDLMKNGRPFGKDYFDELLERIREIRASERRAYQKIADVFEQCSSDYQTDAEVTRKFYAFVQNKMHFAITGKTAAEIIHARADGEHSTMGLTTWKASPDGKVLKSDIKVAKNYLSEKELDKLNRIVIMFIDHAEFQALNEQMMTMKDWIEITDDFLKYNRQEVLQNSGKVSNKEAMAKAGIEYDKFRIKQDKDYISNFDKAVKKFL
ncbi:virulence RhuM family protein [Sporosarcina sp. FA9]|uniref:virulence RhuM family protein n=1 Tax=Sporosarcina sp. FA9 TaxID=3413030 RepID=UPI003F65D67F